MRYVVLWLAMLLFLPSALWAQEERDLLAELSSAVSDKEMERSENLFREIVSTDVESAEMFYWVYLGQRHALAPKVAQELARYFEENYDYEKSNLFYREYVQFAPEDVNRLLAVARTDVLRGKEDEAIKTYEQVLSLQPENLDANIYAGNYYYLQAKLEKQQIENAYKGIKTPTRMQYANYRNELDETFAEKYQKARNHFQKVLTQFSSVGAKKALAEIAQIEKLLSE